MKNAITTFLREKKIGYNIHTKAQSKKVQEYFYGSPNRIFYIKKTVLENPAYLLLDTEWLSFLLEYFWKCWDKDVAEQNL